MSGWVRRGSAEVLREVQILECLSQPSGVYFGDEGSGDRVLEPADGQRKCLKMRIPEDGADTYTSWLNQLSNAIGCTYNKMEFIWT
ncbi:mitochondrial import receptor subunit TOM7 homolog isoform X1 [Lathamus discolor]|uniref:mitochondrial import receptor subunit TOM7 homolog isoform X1 n=1 Tax=Lathamus discolor TaxID=678569 RepID=UPI0032B81BFB